MVMKFKSNEWRQCKMIWVHSSGMRLHRSGTIRFPDGMGDIAHQYRSLQYSDESRLKILSTMYGNRRRGLMALAIELLNKLQLH